MPWLISTAQRTASTTLANLDQRAVAGGLHDPARGVRQPSGSNGALMSLPPPACLLIDTHEPAVPDTSAARSPQAGVRRDPWPVLFMELPRYRIQTPFLADGSYIAIPASRQSHEVF